MDTFDSVQWRSEDEDTDNSRPATANTDDSDPSRAFQAGGLDLHDPPQTGSNADAVDLAGVGNGAMVTSVSDPQTENDMTKDAFVSYLVTTDVRETYSPLLRSFGPPFLVCGAGYRVLRLTSLSARPTSPPSRSPTSASGAALPTLFSSIKCCLANSPPPPCRLSPTNTNWVCCSP